MKKVVPINTVRPDSNILYDATKILQKGGVVAFPTDTAYGLAVNPFNSQAVNRLFTIKDRHPSKPILLLISEQAMLNTLIADASDAAEATMKQFWPGPLTLIFRKKDTLSDVLTAGKETIGIRLPAAALPLELMRQTGFPVTATSANCSGKPTATSASEIERNLGGLLDLILDGGPCRPIASTILDVTGSCPTILRKGKLSPHNIEQFLLKKGFIHNGDGIKKKAPLR